VVQDSCQTSEIRPARPADAVDACRVLQRSISELCDADHHNDPAILEKWLANKTPANVQSWIESPHGYIFVAVNDGAILGVAGVNAAGEITLNYVSPDAGHQQGTPGAARSQSCRAWT
jgi:hypothetical protein